MNRRVLALKYILALDRETQEQDCLGVVLHREHEQKREEAENRALGTRLLKGHEGQ